VLPFDQDALEHSHQVVWTSGRLSPMVEGSDDPFTSHFHALEAGEEESGDDEMPVRGPIRQEINGED
jgi:hypothetical protein